MKDLVTSKISVGQKEAVVQAVVKAMQRGIEKTVDELVNTGIINASNLERVLAQGGILAEHLITEAKVKLIESAEYIVGYLKLISADEKIIIGPTDGMTMIAQAESIFLGYFDYDFVNNRTKVQDQPTQETSVQIFEQIKDGTFGQIFGGLGKELDCLSFSQNQIIRFVLDHAAWLRTDGCATFFLIKEKVDGQDEFFVVEVYQNKDGPGVYAIRFSLKQVWCSAYKHRVVVPQL